MNKKITKDGYQLFIDEKGMPYYLCNKEVERQEKVIRKHILEGLFVALDNANIVIEEINTSYTTTEATDRLIQVLPLDEDQANAITTMKLKAFIQLKRLELEDEYCKISDFLCKASPEAPIYLRF